MRWIKWAMLVGAGCMPALAHAEEPATRPAPQGTFRFWSKSQDDGDNRQSFILVESGGDKDGLRVGGEGLPIPGRILVQVANPQDDDAPHPPDVKGLQHARDGLALTLNILKPVKGPYLGISASPPPAVLRKQLGLKPGMGLVIEFVVPDSPAAKAGVQQYDVLEKLDDQLIVNPQQLSVLVRNHTVGDEVKLGIIHEGKQTTLTTKLAEHELEPLAEEGEVNKWLELVPQPEIHQLPPQAALQQRLETLLRSQRNGLNAGPSSVTWVEGDRSYIVATNNEGHKTFTARDKDGKTTFEGPVDTKEQRDKLSPELKEKLDHMEQHLPGASTWHKAHLGENPQPAPEPKKPKDKDSDEK